MASDERPIVATKRTEEPVRAAVEWTHPMCDECWVTTQERGAIPYRMSEPEQETCCWCGRTTSSGIYRRADSRLLAHHPERGHGQ